jgi:hypothetical protein
MNKNPAAPKKKSIYIAIPGIYVIPMPLESILFSVGAAFSC